MPNPNPIQFDNDDERRVWINVYGNALVSLNRSIGQFGQGVDTDATASAAVDQADAVIRASRDRSEKLAAIRDAQNRGAALAAFASAFEGKGIDAEQSRELAQTALDAMAGPAT